MSRYRHALDQDIGWALTGDRAWSPGRYWAATAVLAASCVFMVVLTVVFAATIQRSAHSETNAPPTRPPTTQTTVPAFNVPMSLAVALRCGQPNYAGQMACLDYLAHSPQETIDGLSFFCAGGAGDPAACRARDTARLLVQANAEIAD